MRGKPRNPSVNKIIIKIIEEKLPFDSGRIRSNRYCRVDFEACIFTEIVLQEKKTSGPVNTHLLSDYLHCNAIVTPVNLLNSWL